MKYSPYIHICIAGLILIGLSSCKTSHIDVPINHKIRMHAHNDYLNSKPLFDALKRGYTSIEIDIIRFDESLIVSHNGNGLDRKPNIKELYINPLKAYLIEHELNIWLLIDLKKYDKETLELLHDIADANQDIFSTRSETSQKKALKIVLSGSMPRREIADNAYYKYFFIDGRPTHLTENYDSHIMPLISTNFAHYATAGSDKIMTIEEKNKISTLVNDTHAQGKQFRFWNTSDQEASWQVLKNIGIDLIGSDDLPGLSEYLNGSK